MKIISLVAVAALSSAQAVGAEVLELPDVYAYQRSVHDQYYSVYSDGPGSMASVHGAASSGGSPFAYASAEARTGWGYRALYEYYFRVDGAGEEAVPLIAYVRLAAVARGNDNASAYATINFNGNNQSLYTNSVDRALSFTGTMMSSIFSYNLGSVTLEVSTDAQYGGTASAFADPLIIIDPAYAAVDPDYRDHLTLTFSSGVVNGSAPGVPEPASWALLLTGFGAVGATLRRRRIATA